MEKEKIDYITLWPLIYEIISEQLDNFTDFMIDLEDPDENGEILWCHIDYKNIDVLNASVLLKNILFCVYRNQLSDSISEWKITQERWVETMEMILKKYDDLILEITWINTDSYWNKF